MGYKVARLKGLQLAQRKRFGLTEFFTRLITMKPFENLVVRIARDFQICILKARAKREVQRLHQDFRADFRKDGFQFIKLVGEVRSNETSIAFLLKRFQVGRQQLKVLIEGRLGA